MPSNGSSQVNIQLTYLQVTEVVKWWLKMTQISYSTHKLQDQKSINGRFKCSTDEPKNWSSHRLQINWTTNHLTNQVKHNKSNTKMSNSQLTRHWPPSWKTDGLTEHPTYWKTTNQPDDEFTAIIQSNMRVTGLKKQVKIFFLVEVLKCTAKEVEKYIF